MKLFQCRKEIDPADLVRSDDDAKGPVYSGKVAFQFPASARCETCGSCPLPPSLDAMDAGIRVKSQYSISVSVDRSIVGRVTRSTRAKEVVPFVCSPHLGRIPSTCRSVTAVPLQNLGGEAGTGLFEGAGPLPSYESPSASVHVEVLLPEPPVLVRGQPAPVGVVVVTPTDLLRTGDVYIRSVAMSLKTSVAGAMSGSPWSVGIARRGTELSGRIRVNGERFRIDSGGWGDLLVVNSSSSFTSCLLRISHTVEVTVGISRGQGDEIHVSPLPNPASEAMLT